MALTIPQLAVRLRISAEIDQEVDPAISLILEHLLDVSNALIEQQIPAAPELAVKTECVDTHDGLPV